MDIEILKEYVKIKHEGQKRKQRSYSTTGCIIV